MNYYYHFQYHPKRESQFGFLTLGDRIMINDLASNSRVAIIVGIWGWETVYVIVNKEIRSLLTAHFLYFLSISLNIFRVLFIPYY